jgi:hypothetical protein
MSEFHNFTRRHHVFEAEGVSSVKQTTPVSVDTQILPKTLLFKDPGQMLARDDISSLQEKFSSFSNPSHINNHV